MTPAEHDMLDALVTLAKDIRAATMDPHSERRIARELTETGVKSIDQLTVEQLRYIINF